MIYLKRAKPFFIIYKIIRWILNPFLRIIYGVRIINKNKSRTSGGLILCSNHVGGLDPVMMCVYFPRPLYFMAKKELFRNFLLGKAISYFNAFPVNRDGVDKTAIINAAKVVKSGNVLGIFPEGTRSATGEIARQGRRGVGLIAFLGNSPVLPMAIYNSNKVSREKTKKRLLSKIKIIFGDIIYTEEIIKNFNKKEAIDIISEISMQRVKELYLQVSKV